MPGEIRYGEAKNVLPLEQLAVGDRVAVPAGAEPVVLAEEHASLKLAGHIAESAVGAVRRFVNDLEHGRGPWDVNPWRLVEHMAELLVRRAQPGTEPVAVAEIETQPAAGQAERADGTEPTERF
jgi:hypothetical protein